MTVTVDGGKVKCEKSACQFGSYQTDYILKSGASRGSRKSTHKGSVSSVSALRCQPCQRALLQPGMHRGARTLLCRPLVLRPRSAGHRPKKEDSEGCQRAVDQERGKILLIVGMYSSLQDGSGGHSRQLREAVPCRLAPVFCDSMAEDGALCFGGQATCLGE